MIIRDKNVSEASGSEHHTLSTLSRSLRYDPTYAQVSLGSPLGHVLGVHKEGASVSKQQQEEPKGDVHHRSTNPYKNDNNQGGNNEG